MSTYFKEDLLNESRENENIVNKAYNYMQALNDKVQFFKKERWIVVAVLVIFFLIRIFLTGGK